MKSGQFTKRAPDASMINAADEAKRRFHPQNPTFSTWINCSRGIILHNFVTLPQHLKKTIMFFL